MKNFLSTQKYECSWNINWLAITLSIMSLLMFFEIASGDPVGYTTLRSTTYDTGTSIRHISKRQERQGPAVISVSPSTGKYNENLNFGE